ncbi:MAG TPA: serine protease, partial [Flavisolibacter sp.]|nr:serine protease [Flavisolibacter sp.]
MIARWNVLQHVAQCYGNLEPVFSKDEEKLHMVRKGQLRLTDLENNSERKRLRMAREAVVTDSMVVVRERINGVNNFQDAFVLEGLTRMAGAVCRILLKGTPIGTGFLVADNIIITNHHVIENKQDAADVLVEFNYELDFNHVPKKSAFFATDPDAFFLSSGLVENEGEAGSGLDFTLVALQTTGTRGESLAAYKPVGLDGNMGKVIKGEACAIIQHPSGLPKKVVLKD